MDRLQRISDIALQKGDSALDNVTPLLTTALNLNQEGVDAGELENKFFQARAAMLSLQNPDGHWCFPLEADCTIPAEYILMMHFMDEVDVVLKLK